jgi:hypothetical protein
LVKRVSLRRSQGYPAEVSDSLRVACVQLTAGSDKAANLEKTERLVARAAELGAELVALPEKWNLVGGPETLTSSMSRSAVTSTVSRRPRSPAMRWS